jgi:hypothetical protein
MSEGAGVASGNFGSHPGVDLTTPSIPIRLLATPVHLSSGNATTNLTKGPKVSLITLTSTSRGRIQSAGDTMQQPGAPLSPRLAPRLAH